MTKKEAIKLFEEKKIRSVWDEDQEEWYFSVVDVIEALTDSANPTDYLKKLRKRDTLLADYIGTNCPQVTMTTETGRQIARNARLELEAKTGKPVISPLNAKDGIMLKGESDKSEEKQEES